jgi:serine phosphatase RsbU (regulator of sigma subunit)
VPSLTIETGNRRGQVLSFDRTVVIGRGSTADLVLEDGTVSRRHAVLTCTNDECVVSDLETANGTFVNGSRIAGPTPLADGDELRLGRMMLRFRSAHSPAAPTLEISIDTSESGTGERARSRSMASDVSVDLVDQGPPSPIVLAVDAEESPTRTGRGVDPQVMLAALTRRLEALSELAAEFGQTFDERSLLTRVMDRLFELLPQAERGMILLRGAKGELVPEVARTRSGETAHIAASRTLIAEVISRRQGVLSVDTQGDARFREVPSLVNLRIRSLICVPMLAYDDVYGVIQLDSTRDLRPFDESDVALVFAIARHLALAMANARLHAQLLGQELFQHDLVLARKIQQQFLTRHTPSAEGFSFSVEYRPALAVGGDFYDFLELPKGRIGIAVGDVSGKGVSAALYVAKLGSELRYNAAGQTEPADILGLVNRALAHDNEEGMFVTVTLVSVDPRSGEMKVANAGHLPPLVREASGAVRALEGAAGSPLGVRTASEFEQRTYVLDAGDVVVLYTDGVTEATDRNKRLFGDDRLREAVRMTPGTPDAVRDGVLSSVRTFLDGEPQNDDITVLAFGAAS